MYERIESYCGGSAGRPTRMAAHTVRLRYDEAVASRRHGFMTRIRLGEIAHARSGDKGGGANIGVIAYTHTGYIVIRERLTAARVAAFFARLDPGTVERYDLPNLGALNFVLPRVLAGGGSRSLRIDAQGKALGQALLEIPIEVDDALLPKCRRRANENAGGTDHD